jgi:hypothetical protein
MLREMHEDDSNPGFQRVAQSVIERIEKDWPLEEQVADLQALVEQLREENAALRARLDSLKAREDAPR